MTETWKVTHFKNEWDAATRTWTREDLVMFVGLSKAGADAVLAANPTMALGASPETVERSDGLHKLADGTLAHVADDGAVTPWMCDWLIKVANNHPEPDSIEDCYDIVPCGSPMRDADYGDDTVVCGAGHEFGGMQRRSAPYGPDWQDEQRAMDDERYGF
jgi:hypothetical protein